MTELPNFMAAHGETLVENGYRILPIIPGKKVPGRYQVGEWTPYPSWSRHCDRDISKFELDMWLRWPECAIGLACGNVIGIDIDVWDDSKHVDYPRGRPGEDAEISIAIEKLARDMLGDTPVYRIGQSPKRALYYRAETPFQGRKRHPIEVYGRGSQMVIHGIHPGTGKPYEWPDGNLIETDISALPVVTEAQAMAWLEAAFAIIPQSFKPATLSSGDGKSVWRGPSDPRGTYEAIKSALAFIPNDDLDGSSWILMCNAIKAALGPQGCDLWVTWSQSSAKSGASGKSDTGKRYASARPVNVGAGTIYYTAEQRGWTPDADLILNGATADRASMLHPAADMLAATDAAMNAARSSMPALPPLPAVPVPSGMLNVGGIIGELMSLCVNTARSPQPFLALGAAIVTIGTLAGRKYATQSNLRTNLYAIGIADSGGGKENARSVLKEVLFRAGLQDYLGGGKIASGSGLVTSLERHPCRVFFLDEFGQQIAGMTGPKAPPHKAEIWSILTELYTSSNSVYLGAEYSDQKLRPRVDIIQPCASVWGTTVPGPFWSSLEGGAMTDGSLARFLIFQTDNSYPDRNKKPDALNVSEDLIASLRLIVAGVGEPSDLPELPGQTPEPYRVPETSGAYAYLESLTDEQTELLRAYEGTSKSAVIARLDENVRRVALIRAISDCPSNPEITEENVKWARMLVDHCMRTILRDSDRFVASNTTEASHKRLLDIIRKAGSISQNELKRKTQWLTGKAFIDIITALIDAGQVSKTITGAGKAGKPGATYSYIQPDETEGGRVYH